MEKDKLAQAIAGAHEVRVSQGAFCKAEEGPCERVLPHAAVRDLVAAIEFERSQSNTVVACQADAHVAFLRNGDTIATISYLSYVGLMTSEAWSGDLQLTRHSQEAVNRWLEAHEIRAPNGCRPKPVTGGR